MNYAYCSSKDCKHSQMYGESRGGMNRRPSATVPMQRFCTECGSPMIGACPSCGAYRQNMEHKCCPDCGKPYK